MKIFYCCYGGAHTSVVAASVHLGYLPSDRIPTTEEVLSIPNYDKSPNLKVGTPLFMGVDEFANEVFVMGMGHNRDYFAKLTYEYSRLLSNGDTSGIRIINALSCINNYIRLGGFLSRRVNLVKIGRPITVYGIRKNYKYFVALVKNFKSTINID
ncbi:DUF3189 family protein [Serpentinicella alkaliphila]|uniref:Uncharacterized protein DUF3189 n=1 Tax=Serpentinicella alkaliphila TaxID=1734049 RepID=A0A4R2T8W5_9FIRM|nr:DUF3189 family protein [Serpentinicella alkaliphila]QUH26087.1 DUF3189 family protein [Serpentinicella alkaliphila]TCP99100.1 uncharacterized protein DUF3189 [Serpentinicella alkaliphila]